MSWPGAGPVDYYAVLGVAPGATAEEIAKAYRRAARLNHPDKAQGQCASVAKFQVIQEAYETLRDPARRLVYDELRGNGELGAAASPPAAESMRPEEVAAVPEGPSTGGLALGTCIMASAFAWTCGVSAALGAAFCGVAGRMPDSSGRQCVLGALGVLMLWGSPLAWMLGMYLITLVALWILWEEKDQLPEFLPYLLFAGYLLLYLLAPVRPTARVLFELPGITFVEEDAEDVSDNTLPECAAIFTWGIVLLRIVQARYFSAKRGQGKPSTEAWEV